MKLDLDKKSPNEEGEQIFTDQLEIRTRPIMISKDNNNDKTLEDDLFNVALGSLKIGISASLNYRTGPYQQKRRSSVDSIQPQTLVTSPIKHTQRTHVGSVHLPVSPFYCTDKRVTLYKTEMCRTFEETGTCKYGTKCQFAHDQSELRTLQRHPRYKTEICKTFWEQGNCPYGKRCCFIHTENEVRQERSEDVKLASASVCKEESRLLSLIQKHEEGDHHPRWITKSKFEGSSSLHNRSSYKEDSFLDCYMMGPIGSMSPGYFKTTPILMNESIFECISVKSDVSEGWDEESVGLLPSDLIS